MRMTMGRACLLAIVCGALLASTAVAASDYTDGEVAQKAQDVMEDRRQLLGTFPRLSSEQSLDYLLAHLGQNGLLFVGVFPRDHVDSEDAFHHRRTFEAWEKLAKDQSFLAGFGKFAAHLGSRLPNPDSSSARFPPLTLSPPHPHPHPAPPATSPAVHAGAPNKAC